MIDGENLKRNVRRMQRPLAAAVLCGTIAVSLQGCIGLAVGGAVAGTMAATDRRTFGAQTEDKSIIVKGETRLRNALGDGAHINVNTFNRRVLLTGEVRDEQMKATAEREIAAIEGVQGVVNELEVGGTSSFTSRSNDTLITGKVKASFVDTRDINVNNYKVVTERGIVYLMGRVGQREGAMAGEVARGVGGVQKVVKVFEYIGDDEARQSSASPAPAQ
ncbi:BON domain-containing protein [Undibacterium arcticum]|uniref:BON domain-containing protein n=1 Tax=Undibacterium arcticum TaxID=1762892 RepID=A0ABV7F121_9BURK